MHAAALKPIKHDDAASLSEAVYQTLLEAIVSRRLASGTVLSEVALSKSLDVSRTPVHDALRQLAKDGLVEQQTGHRARVAQFTPDDVYEIFEIRKYLEGPAAELAAGRMDLRHLAPLRTMAEALAANPQAVDWIERWADFDDAFHNAIATCSGNKRLAQDINRYRLLHRGFNRMSTTPEVLQQALQEHFAILDALQARDGERAKSTMLAHIASWQDFFVRNFPRD